MDKDSEMGWRAGEVGGLGGGQFPCKVPMYVPMNGFRYVGTYSNSVDRAYLDTL